eukprot:403339669
MQLRRISIQLATTLAFLLVSTSAQDQNTTTNETATNETVPAQNQSAPASFQVTATYQTDYGMLFYDRKDTQGRYVERLEMYYAMPPIGECNTSTTVGDIQSSLALSNVLMPAAAAQLNPDLTVVCCDYYSPQRGYQFTKCEQGIGIVILANKIGTERDLFYINATDQQVGISNITWDGLISLLQQYCNSSGLLQSPTPPEFLSIPVDWFGFFQEWEQNPQISNWTSNDFNIWLNNWGQFLNATGQTPGTQNLTNTSSQAPTRLRRRLQDATVTDATTAEAANATATAANETAAAANETAAAANETAAAANETAAAANETAAANATNGTTNATGAANATNETGAANATNETGAANATNETAGANATEPIPANNTNETAASNASSGIDNTTVNNTNFYLPEYDNFNNTQILQSLEERGLLNPFLEWYRFYFGVNGVAVQWFSSGGGQPPIVRRRNLQETAQQAFTGGETAVPPGMESIVAWIQETTNAFLSVVDPVSQAQNAVLVPLPQNQSTGPVLQSSGSFIPIVLNTNNYRLAQYCLSYPTASAIDVFCCRNTDNDNHVCYSLANVNQFFQVETLNLCNQAQAAFTSCAANDITCMQNNLFDWFNNNSLAIPYGFLFFNTIYQETVLNQCVENVPGFTVSPTTFSQMFQRQINDLGGP